MRVAVILVILKILAYVKQVRAVAAWPPGARTYLSPIAVLPRLVQKQAQVAAETGCAFFNTFEAMGGSGTMGRWYQAEPRMVSADFIHPLPSGARIVGALLYQALYDGYNNWKMQQLRKTRITATGTPPVGAQPQERRAR